MVKVIHSKEVRLDLTTMIRIVIEVCAYKITKFSFIEIWSG